MESDSKRLSDVLNTLDGGLDAGWDPSLLKPNQYAAGINASNRGGFFGTRDGWLQRVLSFSSPQVQSNFNGGIFQGAIDYTSSDPLQNSLLVAVGGRLFRINLAQNFMVTDISPVLAVLTTGSFVVPAVSGSVTVDVSVETPFSIGQNLIMDSGSYTVTAVAVDQITVTYNGGAANASVASGVGVQDYQGNQIFALVVNYSGTKLVDWWTGQNYAFAATPGQSVVIFDGSSSTVANQSLAQLPSAWIGTYSWGRNWLANVDKRTYVASDLTGDPSGSAALAYTDAILYMTENNLLAGGGSFSIPANFGDIHAMATLPQLDSSLGMGPVLIGCQNGVFTNQAPTDRTTWQNLTYPIQSVAYSGFGPTGPRNHCIINSDWWFRSTDGIRQLIAARRDFQYGVGNTPQSVEVNPYLEKDERELLLYGSMMQFDNRSYNTCNPSNVNGKGIIHKGLLTNNFDTISSLAGKESPVWESLHTGLDVFQCLSINDNGNERGFIFSLNPDGTTIDLWEIIPGQTSDIEVKSFSTNLIPSGSSFNNPGTGVYYYAAGGLVSAGHTYYIIWGPNESGAYIPNPGGGSDFMANPGAGIITTMTLSPLANPTLFRITGSAFLGVTAILANTLSSFSYQSIVTTLDTRRMDYSTPANLKKQTTCELYLNEISDSVSVQVFFRPDDYPTWTLWGTIPLCAPVKQCGLVPASGCTILWTPNLEQYAVRIMLPRPPETINPVTGRPINLFYSMQYRLVITGHARVQQFKPWAVVVQQETEGAAPPASAVCTALSACDENIYTYSSYGP